MPIGTVSARIDTAIFANRLRNIELQLCVTSPGALRKPRDLLFDRDACIGAVIIVNRSTGCKFGPFALALFLFPERHIEPEPILALYPLSLRPMGKP